MAGLFGWYSLATVTMAALATEGGWMWKSGARSTSKGFKHRFFKVEGSQLQYFKNPGGTKPAGVIDLTTCKDFRKAGAFGAQPKE